jgi:hypothetical protein
MAVGTVFTLFFVPAIYMLIARQHKALPQEETGPGPGSGELLPASEQ